MEAPKLPVPDGALARMVVMTPTDTLVANRAMISPLMARNAARGLSESRRPARRAAGRWARRAMSREPTMVSHGPAMTRPAMIRKQPEK